MKYDFIEIGTSHFGTLLHGAEAGIRGIAVEPISEYLDQLPNLPLEEKIK